MGTPAHEGPPTLFRSHVHHLTRQLDLGSLGPWSHRSECCSLAQGVEKAGLFRSTTFVGVLCSKGVLPRRSLMNCPSLALTSLLLSALLIGAPACGGDASDDPTDSGETTSETRPDEGVDNADAATRSNGSDTTTPGGTEAPSEDVNTEGPSDSSDDTGASPGPCAPSCVGKTCGDDGCGGSCGVCDNGDTCSDTGTCIGPPCTIANVSRAEICLSTCTSPLRDGLSAALRTARSSGAVRELTSVGQRRGELQPFGGSAAIQAPPPQQPAAFGPIPTTP